MLFDLGADSNTIGGTTVAARNVISGNDSVGVDLGSFRNLIQGNFIGTDASGTAALGSQQNGVNLGRSSNTIGGTTPGAVNVISGNGAGVVAFGSGNFILGNFIGTDVSGTRALGNSSCGVAASFGDSITIGGTTAGAGNVISGNLRGVLVIQSTGTVIEGNFIGTDASGSSPLGNTENGVELGSNSEQTIGPHNVIAFNGGQGVQVESGLGNRITANSIFSNGSLGVGLGGFGSPKRNDPGDADTGPNNLQNYPIINSVSVSGGNTTIAGTHQ